MQILAILCVVAAALLFRAAPEGVHLQSVGSLVLLAVSIGAWCAAAAGSLRDSLRPLAKGLGLTPEGGFSFLSAEHTYLRGEHEGRRVEIRVDRTAGGRNSGKVFYSFEGLVPLRGDPALKIKILPKLEHSWDLYLEILPAKLQGSWPWAEGYDVYGAPEKAALDVLTRVPPALFGALRHREAGGDAVRLAGGCCRFVISTVDMLPSVGRLGALLRLCSALAGAADGIASAR
jgi:hypothetical protein